MWSVKHQPRSVTDLATHPKKTEEVRHWLKLSTSSSTSPKALLISGPAGAAKTATLTVLCRELKECNTNEIKMMYLRIIYLYASKKYWFFVDWPTSRSLREEREDFLASFFAKT